MRTFNVAYRSDQVGFEIYNETQRTETDPTYLAAIAEAANELHRLYGDKIKVIVAPGYYAGQYGFTAAGPFRRDLFEAQHIGFAQHAGYTPHEFSHQGLDGDLTKYYHRLPFFPDPANKTDYVASAVAAATADSASADQIAALTASLNGYFDNTSEQTESDGVKDFSTTWALTFIYGNYLLENGEGNFFAPWMAANDVTGDMMHPTEIGVHRDYAGLGATVADAARFLALHRKYAVEARGMNGLIGWNDAGGHFSFGEDINHGVGDYIPDGPLEKAMARAIGLHADFSPDELGDRLVYFGSSKAAIEALSASDDQRGIFVKLQITDTAGARTILGSTGDGGAQLVIGPDETLVVNRQNVAPQGGTNVPVPTGIPVVVGVAMSLDSQYQYINGRRLGPGEQFDYEDKATFVSGNTILVGEAGTGAETEPFVGTILSPYLITTGVVTPEEIDLIIGFLESYVPPVEYQLRNTYLVIDTDADVAIQLGGGRFVRHTGALTADRSVTFDTTDAAVGDVVRVTRTGSGAHNLDLGGLKNLTTDTWADLVFDGAALRLSGYGAL
jgi:hypothetical protein